MRTKFILFICKGNSGRSQMAEAFFNHLSKTGKAISAGTEPDERIHPWTVQVMKEAGIDVSQQKPKLLTNELMEKADKIIVLDSDLLENILPDYLSKVDNWSIEKLLEKHIEQIREIRDQIKRKVEYLFN